MKKVYYAHTMVSYGSTIEQADIKLLESLGLEVLNPNQLIHQKECEIYAKVHGWDKVMEYFTALVKTCDFIAFRGNPDGSILSGVSAELKQALLSKIPIIELPCSLNKRMMEYPETKQYLVELGHYKIKNNNYHGW